MQYSLRRITFALSILLATTIAAVFLFTATSLVPYWQGLSGEEIQDWFAGPFTRFSIMMVPVHFLSIASLGAAYILHRKTSRSRLLLIALMALLICQAFNFTLYGAVLNPALQSQNLAPEVALATLDRWEVFHTIRTFAITLCVLVLLVLVVKPKSADG